MHTSVPRCSCEIALIPHQNTSEKSNYKCEEETGALESCICLENSGKNASHEAELGRISGCAGVRPKGITEVTDRIKIGGFQAFRGSEAQGKTDMLQMQIHVL